MRGLHECMCSCPVAIDCGFLLPPLNGNVEFSETTFQSVAMYSCDQGFALVGNFIRICLVNGRWSGEEPVCRFGENLANRSLIPHPKVYAAIRSHLSLLNALSFNHIQTQSM